MWSAGKPYILLLFGAIAQMLANGEIAELPSIFQYPRFAFKYEKPTEQKIRQEYIRAWQFIGVV